MSFEWTGCESSQMPAVCFSFTKGRKFVVPALSTPAVCSSCVSIRSKNEDVDVSAICQKFGGGGHKLAAGARVRGTLAEVEQRLLQTICEVIDCSDQRPPG